MENFMMEAIEEAKEAKVKGDLPFGAVLVCDDKIISRGHAENNTTGDVTRHAELLAVQRGCLALSKNDLSECTIYCTNEPCIMCAAAIFQAGISKVIIGASRSDLPELLRPRKIAIDNLAEDSSYKIEILRGVLKDKIIPLFDGVLKK